METNLGVPVCRHFGKCGGCLYQDLPYEVYIQKKENFIRRAFTDQGIEAEINPIISVPFGTRRRATFAFRKGIIGFNETKSHQIIGLDACPALVKELSDFLIPLKGLAQNLKGSGDIAVLSTPFGIDMHIKRTGTAPTLAQREFLADFALKHQVARLLYNGEPIVQKINLPFAPDSFLQPSAEGEKVLVDLVVKCASDARNAVDLFCGAGTFTRPLAEQGIKIIGYDIASDSLHALGNLGKERDLFRNPLLANEFQQVDTVVIDPPRAGALQQCIQLAQSAVSKIIMISCNPTTCARDIRILMEKGAYKLNPITPVDQFVYTNHIELFCCLSR